MLAGGPDAVRSRAKGVGHGQDVVERLVRGAVDLVAGEGTPHGCLCVNSVHACGPDAHAVRRDAIAVRKAGEAALRRRLEQATDLPSRHDPATLAALVHTITDGIAVQAATGRSHDELRRIGDLALHAVLT
ncbi:hypothetical protein ACFYY8_12960 [Streptosporangium sp. NPDC001559]|uniref:hypothetical protein n=1 Tax=Streptosporangium sp. NPDC001559 TaxID=3366187 RepID=UPI0036E025EE